MTASLKSLASLEGRQKYYKYDLSDPTTLVPHQAPYLDPRFNQELQERYGFDPNGDPILRITWAGDLPATRFRTDPNGVVQSYQGRKYQFMRVRKDIGCEYHDKDGKKVFVTKVDDVPDDCPFVFVPHWSDLGILKFVIEMKFTAAQMVQMGWYPEFDKEDFYTFCQKNGQKYRADPSPTGEYVYIHFIETPEGEYKDVEQSDLDAIHYMFHRSLNESEEEFIRRKRSEMDKIAMMTEKAEDEKMTSLIANARIKAEKKLAKAKPLIYT